MTSIHPVRTPVGDEAWLVTDYAQVRRLLDDDRLGRSHRKPETASRTGESALFGGPLGDFDTEQADHARMRALLQPHFSPGTCGRWNPGSRRSPPACWTTWRIRATRPICTRGWRCRCPSS